MRGSLNAAAGEAKRARRVLLAMLLVGCSGNSETWPSAERLPPTYAEAAAAIAKRQSVDDRIAAPGARSLLLSVGAPTPRAILLLHGLTDSPKQFEDFANLLHADGNNVYVPRLPQHGLRGADPAVLSRLTAEQLEGAADSIIYEVRGLGDSVIVVGLSMGGTIAAWIAQEYAVRRAVLIAPAIEPARIPSMLDRPIIGLAARLPSVTRRDKPDTARPSREAGFNSRAVAEILQLGSFVLAKASTAAPRTRQITVLVNAADRTISDPAAERIANEWSRHGATVSTYELPDSLRLPHDVLEVAHARARAATVLALLRQLAYGEQPSLLVGR